MAGAGRRRAWTGGSASTSPRHPRRAGAPRGSPRSPKPNPLSKKPEQSLQVLLREEPLPAAGPSSLRRLASRLQLPGGHPQLNSSRRHLGTLVHPATLLRAPRHSAGRRGCTRSPARRPHSPPAVGWNWRGPARTLSASPQSLARRGSRTLETLSAPPPSLVQPWRCTNPKFSCHTRIYMGLGCTEGQGKSQASPYHRLQ